MDWHGYPQHPDAHPERPWWRRHAGDTQILMGLVRSDGRWAGHEAGMMACDAAHPLPPPEPRCGQVWTDITDGEEVQVVAVGDYGVRLGNGDGLSLIDWPHLPGGAHSVWVLVAGPGAPWAPIGDGHRPRAQRAMTPCSPTSDD